jgi:DNA-binding NarL/FixJ family response regulator
VRVILADDAVIVREGLARLLAERGIEILARVGTAAELLQQVAADHPDVAVIDIRMPPTYTNEGLLAAQRIRNEHPHVGALVLSQYIEVDYALKLVTGTSDRVGYLLKDRIADVDDFVSALETVAAGGTVIEPTLVAELLNAPTARNPLNRLTARERDVLTLVAEGRTDRGIAEQLYVTRKTVEAHIRSILNKLDLPTDATENRRVHAVLTYLRYTGRPKPEPTTPKRTEDTDVPESPRSTSPAP